MSHMGMSSVSVLTLNTHCHRMSEMRVLRSYSLSKYFNNLLKRNVDIPADRCAAYIRRTTCFWLINLKLTLRKETIYYLLFVNRNTICLSHLAQRPTSVSTSVCLQNRAKQVGGTRKVGETREVGGNFGRGKKTSRPILYSFLCFDTHYRGRSAEITLIPTKH